MADHVSCLTVQHKIVTLNSDRYNTVSVIANCKKFCFTLQTAQTLIMLIDEICDPPNDQRHCRPN